VEHGSTHSRTLACKTLSTIFCGGSLAEVMRGRFESDQTRLRAKLSHRENVERSATRALFRDVTASGIKTHTRTHTHSHILYIQMLFRKAGVDVCGKRCVYVYTELKTNGRQLFIARRWFKGVSGAHCRARVTCPASAKPNVFLLLFAFRVH